MIFVLAFLVGFAMLGAIPFVREREVKFWLGLGGGIIVGYAVATMLVIMEMERQLWD